MINIEKNYNIRKNPCLLKKEKGFINNSLKHLNTELSEFESMYNKCSCESLNCKTCNRLLINWLEEDSVIIKY